MTRVAVIGKVIDIRPTEWHDGPPPHVGWWHVGADLGGSQSWWRWWDGKRWSALVFDDDRPNELAYWAARPADRFGGPIRWSHYWPEGARVPRVQP